MKALPPSLQAHLDTGATTLCWCWKLTRSDSQVMGFTDHDEDVAFDGMTYAAASGFTASEVQSTLGLAVDNLAVIGALSAAALTEDDLAAGLYDDADIEIWRVNWQDAESQRVLMRKGNLGEVSRGKTAFEAEMRGLAHKLNQPVGRAFLKNCDADLGDTRCGVDLGQGTFTGNGAVSAVLTPSRVFTASGLDPFTSGWFSGGKLTWTTGANAGRAMEVKAHGKANAVTVDLWQAMSEAVAPGDQFTISAGCDKTFATCKAKFDNIANFRGFPYMPGNDAVIAYPVRGQGNLDGKSRYGN